MAERFAIHYHFHFLGADRRVIVVHEAMHSKFLAWINSNAAVAVRKLQRLSHANVAPTATEGPSSRLGQEVDVGLRRTVEDGKFKRVQLDIDIIDTARIERCQHVFNGRKQHALFHQAGGVTDARYVADVGFNLETIEIHAAENDAGVCGSGCKPDVAADGSVKAEAVNFYGALDCQLIRHTNAAMIILTFR